MEVRPKIKLNLSKADNAIELVSKIMLLFMWGLTMYAFLKLPAIIPIHFSGEGKVDNFGSKNFLFILPVLATVIYFGLSQLNKFPHIFNYLIIITEENAERQYTIATRMLRYLKLAILVIFSIVILFSYQTSIGAKDGLGVWFLPLVFILILLPTIIFLSQSFKKEK
jgi:hypothetical protein